MEALDCAIIFDDVDVVDDVISNNFYELWNDGILMTLNAGDYSRK
jgi:hypothetical protein